MRGPILFLAVGLLLLAGCSNLRKRKSLPTVSQVDLTRYAGRWFEVARLPAPFQKESENAEARYSLNPDGSIQVVNIAHTAGGGTRSIEGTARPVPGSEGARLRVRFSGLAGLIPVSRDGNYWIIGLDPDYRFAMVGTPNRRFLWLLAREQHPPSGRIERALDRARSLGFKTDQIRRARWGNG